MVTICTTCFNKKSLYFTHNTYFPNSINQTITAMETHLVLFEVRTEVFLCYLDGLGISKGPLQLLALIKVLDRVVNLNAEAALTGIGCCAYVLPRITRRSNMRFP